MASGTEEKKSSTFAVVAALVAGSALAGVYGMRGSASENQLTSTPIARPSPNNDLKYIIIACSKDPSASINIPIAQFRDGDAELCRHPLQRAAKNLELLQPVFEKIAAAVGIDKKLLFNIYNHETRLGLVPTGQTSTSAAGNFQIVGDTAQDQDMVIDKSLRLQALLRELTPELSVDVDTPISSELAEERENINVSILAPVRDAMRAAIYIKSIQTKLANGGYEATPANVLIGYVYGANSATRVLDALAKKPEETVDHVVSLKFLQNNKLAEMKRSVARFHAIYVEAYASYERDTEGFLATGKLTSMSQGILQLTQALDKVAAAADRAKHPTVAPHTAAHNQNKHETAPPDRRAHPPSIVEKIKSSFRGKSHGLS